MKCIIAAFALISAVCIISSRSSPISGRDEGTQSVAAANSKSSLGKIVIEANTNLDANGNNQDTFVKGSYNQTWGDTNDIHIDSAAFVQESFGSRNGLRYGGNVRLVVPISN